MSDSWISWNPRIDEPSKPWPSSKVLSSRVDAGTVTCCMMPGRSQNRKSTNSTPSVVDDRQHFGRCALLSRVPPGDGVGARSSLVAAAASSGWDFPVVARM